MLTTTIAITNDTANLIISVLDVPARILVDHIVRPFG
jgi:hypothetical protein